MKKVIKKLGKKGYSFFKKSTCIILIGLSVQSFLFKMPYFIVLGVMLLSVSLTLSSWFNKILLSRSINLSILNKIFIIIGNIFKFKSLSYIGYISLLLNVIIQTSFLWRKVPWWLYLMIVGVILVVYATIKESKKK